MLSLDVNLTFIAILCAHYFFSNDITVR